MPLLSSIGPAVIKCKDPSYIYQSKNVRGVKVLDNYGNLRSNSKGSSSNLASLLLTLMRFKQIKKKNIIKKPKGEFGDNE